MKLLSRSKKAKTILCLDAWLGKHSPAFLEKLARDIKVHQFLNSSKGIRKLYRSIRAGIEDGTIDWSSPM